MQRLSLLTPMSLCAVMAVALALAPVTTASADTVGGAVQAVQATQPATATTPSAAGTFAKLTPTRLLDTRIQLGANGAVGPQGTVALHVLGVAGVPTTNVAAVALTVTATRPAGSGYLTVYPAGATRPNASSLNFVAGQNVANMVIVPVGAGGNVALFNGSGADVDMLADITGYFTGGTPAVAGSFHALTAHRLLDTRFGVGAAAPQPESAVSVRVTGVGGVPADGVASVVVNLTATRAAGSGFLTASADGAAVPATSSLDFGANLNVANMAVVRVGADGRISIFNGSGATVQVVADVLGYYLGGSATALGSFQSVAQQRILDTRTGVGATGLLIRNTAMPLRVMGAAGIPASGVSAVVMNLTVASPTGGGFLTAYPDNTTRPNTSNLNFGPWQTTAALVTVPVGVDGYLRLYNGGGSTHVVADIVGYYLGTGPRPCDLVPPDPAGTSVTRWGPVVQCVLGMLGVPSASNVADVETVIEYESSGDPNAINNWDSNAQAGHPSEGLVQVIQPTFDYYRSPILPANLYDPAANIYAGMHYAIATYGSIHNIPGLVSLRNGGGYVGYIVRK